MFDSIHEECGVFGIYDKHNTDVATSAYYALYALQHRGQESCGIAVNDDGVITAHRDMGLVPDVFTPRVLEDLGEGNIAVGHVRYSTTGCGNRVNAQPLMVKHIKGPMVVAHNGNLVNAGELRDRYQKQGAIFQTTTDSEILLHQLADPTYFGQRDRIRAALAELARRLGRAHLYVFRADGENEAFYRALGFAACGRWAQARRKGETP